jgi:hypothetical protein
MPKLNTAIEALSKIFSISLLGLPALTVPVYDRHRTGGSPHAEVIWFDRPARFQFGFLHRHLFLWGLPQCYGHGGPGYDDGDDDQGNENEHRHWGSPPSALAVVLLQ